MTEVEKTHSYKKEAALAQPRVVIVSGGFGGLYAARLRLFGAEILNRDAHEAARTKSFIP